jgi:hypothetical protein
VFADSRVTRFGEFSPKGQLFTFSSFFKITKVDQKLGILLPSKKICTNGDLLLLRWATFWADFSQTHVVTLAGRYEKQKRPFVIFFVKGRRQPFELKNSFSPLM